MVIVSFVVNDWLVVKIVLGVGMSIGLFAAGMVLFRGARDAWNGVSKIRELRRAGELQDYRVRFSKPQIVSGVIAFLLFLLWAYLNLRAHGILK
jgi:hypothetical protein